MTVSDRSGERVDDGAFRAGSGSPLVLLHGAGMSYRAWTPTIEAFAEHHRVFAPSLPGHRHGPTWTPAPGLVTIDDLVDEVCAQLDAEGIDTAHVVGNSLGGAVALELARRGRARSVVALSPAGCWRSGWDLRRLVWTFRAIRTLSWPFLARGLGTTPSRRRLLLGVAMEHGERLSAADFLRTAADLRACSVLPHLLAAAGHHGPTTTFSQLPCPVRIAWAEHDRMIPWRRYGAPMRQVVPDAEFLRLPGVGHVPMWDDPDLVVQTVLGITRPADVRGEVLA